jgi:hypothetical protein
MKGLQFWVPNPRLKGGATTAQNEFAPKVEGHAMLHRATAMERTSTPHGTNTLAHPCHVASTSRTGPRTGRTAR